MMLDSLTGRIRDLALRSKHVSGLDTSVIPSGQGEWMQLKAPYKLLERARANSELGFPTTLKPSVTGDLGYQLSPSSSSDSTYGAVQARERTAQTRSQSLLNWAEHTTWIIPPNENNTTENTMAGNFPRTFTSPRRTIPSASPSSPRFHGASVSNDDDHDSASLTTAVLPDNPTLIPGPPAGSDSLGTTAVSAVDQSLPRNLTVSEQSSPYIQYLYGALNRQGYSTTNSARTSYTRVDSMALENETDQEREPGGERVVEENATQVEQIQAIPPTPIVSICFLLISGKRKVMTFEPETTVGRAKELLFHSWPTGPDWSDERPPAPSYLRILHLGKILQDEDSLKACNFPAHTPSTSPSSVPAVPSIVHLAIRPSGPGMPNPRDSNDLEKKNKSTRTRLVARFSSVLASGDGGGVDPAPPLGPGASAGNPATPEDNSHARSCCIIC
ncbi:hypothetical protein D9757_007111 [Collybiopsis confluens]|uniref:UBL3-like ubiquitin domain-containing protein n=1 Tax=Collybiopsis confluens TaxID=2823264 RepID=A0A8H5M4U9_9AGAR|nr:hypothetical protein D9757_007111 [Collybiopsis confluens]